MAANGLHLWRVKFRSDDGEEYERYVVTRLGTVEQVEDVVRQAGADGVYRGYLNKLLEATWLGQAINGSLEAPRAAQKPQAR